MIKSLKDIIIVLDMDNTLLTAQKGIPLCNIETIKLFISLGGNFTVATGRTVESVRRYLPQLPLSAPAITYGGAVLYDFANERRIQNKIINKKSALAAIKAVQDNYYGIGIEIMAENGEIYVVAANEYTYKHTLLEKLKYIICQPEHILCEWNKVLFATSNKQQHEISAFLNAKHYDGIYFIATHKNYFEIMTSNASKGIALHELCSYLNIPVENSIAIGDYFNDLEIMKAAGYAVAVKHAPIEVQKVADEITASCTEGGVGQFIYSLIKKYS